jgi:hypothetical protein
MDVVTPERNGLSPKEIRTHFSSRQLNFMLIVGAWKLLGGLTIVVPGVPRLKEWAYAGIVFDLSGAGWSHWAVSDPAAKLVAPIVLLATAILSWQLRPASRRPGRSVL